MKQLLRWVVALVFRVKLVHFERLWGEEPSIILPHHISFLDAVFLYIFLPGKVCFAVSTQVAKRFSFVVKWVNHVVVDTYNPYHLKQLTYLVNTGEKVVFFPEGRISTTGGLMKVYSGVGFVALKTKAKVYPVIFSGLEYSKLSRIRDRVNSRWLPAVSIYVDEPLQMRKEWHGRYQQKKEEVNNRILEALQQAKFKAKHKQDKINLFNQLIEAGKLHGFKKTMAQDGMTAITYGKGLISTYVLGGKFKVQFAEEQTIGILLPNSVGHLVTLFALLRLNKRPAILNFSAGVQNNMDCAEAAGIKSLITSRLFIEKAKLTELAEALGAKYRILYLEDVRKDISLWDKLRGYFQFRMGCKAVADEHSSIVLFTSGSENKPKGVVLSHASLLANIQQISCVIDYTPRDKMLNPLPMFHAFGLTAGALLPVLEGLHVYLYPNPLHYKVIPELAYEHNITILLGTPTFLLGYARNAHNYDFYSLRFAIAGGERLKSEVRELWEEKFGIRIYEGYGTTEMAPVLSLNTPLFYKKGTVGKFLPGIQWKLETVEGIAEGGNLLVQGPNAMNGYLLHGKGFAKQEGWYNCGDVVEIDKDGFIKIRARLKRFAKISGEMISLDAIENMAELCFAEGRNAVVHTSEGKKGETIILYTTDATATKQRFREFLTRSGHSLLNMPAHIQVTDSLPLLGNGKTDYVQLRERASQEFKE